MNTGIFILLGSLALFGCSREIPTDELISDLDSASDGDRVKAVRSLQNRTADASKVIPALIRCLNDADGDVRRSAAIGLGYYGAEAKEAIPALEAMQQDSDARVREAAKVAISRITENRE
jgi:HEAT repeat protein